MLLLSLWFSGQRGKERTNYTLHTLAVAVSMLVLYFLMVCFNLFSPTWSDYSLFSAVFLSICIRRALTAFRTHAQSCTWFSFYQWTVKSNSTTRFFLCCAAEAGSKPSAPHTHAKLCCTLCFWIRLRKFDQPDKNVLSPHSILVSIFIKVNLLKVGKKAN